MPPAVSLHLGMAGKGDRVNGERAEHHLCGWEGGEIEDPW